MDLETALAGLREIHNTVLNKYQAFEHEFDTEQEAVEHEQRLLDDLQSAADVLQVGRPGVAMPDADDWYLPLAICRNGRTSSGAPRTRTPSAEMRRADARAGESMDRTRYCRNSRSSRRRRYRRTRRYGLVGTSKGSRARQGVSAKRSPSSGNGLPNPG